MNEDEETLEELFEKIPKFITTYDRRYYLIISYSDTKEWLISYRDGEYSYKLENEEFFFGMDLSNVLVKVIKQLKKEGIIVRTENG